MTSAATFAVRTLLLPLVICLGCLGITAQPAADSSSSGSHAADVRLAASPQPAQAGTDALERVDTPELDPSIFDESASPTFSLGLLALVRPGLWAVRSQAAVDSPLVPRAPPHRSIRS